MNDDQNALASFPGTARLFPLPNLVLFPHVVQPLHVFEPRYRQLTRRHSRHRPADRAGAAPPRLGGAIRSAPSIHAIACLGRVIAEQQMPDGRYNLLVRGLSRLQIHGEQSGDRPYRVARAELLIDGPLPTLPEAKALRKELADKVLPRFAAGTPRKQLRELFRGELPLGALCDILGFALPFPVEHKQALLELLHVTRRATRLLSLLDALVPSPVELDPDRKFPPDFSPN